MASTSVVTVNTLNKNADVIEITDASDHTGHTQTATSAIFTFPDDTTKTVALWNTNFASVNLTMEITSALLGVSTIVDGVWSVVLRITEGSPTLDSSPVYFLRDTNAYNCWATEYEKYLEKKSDLTERDLTIVREILQAADENTRQFKFTEANKLVAKALVICEAGCR